MYIFNYSDKNSLTLVYFLFNVQFLAHGSLAKFAKLAFVSRTDLIRRKFANINHARIEQQILALYPH